METWELLVKSDEEILLDVSFKSKKPLSIRQTCFFLKFINQIIEVKIPQIEKEV